MKLTEAQRIMEGREEPHEYRISFERVEGRILAGDFFPDRDEKPISGLANAWHMAHAFAAKTRGRYVNIYVIHARDFTPVEGYAALRIENR